MSLSIRLQAFAWWARRSWYIYRHGVRFGFDGSCLPNLGENRFVRVKRRGNYIDITDKASGETIRLIPSHSSLGMWVELDSPSGYSTARTNVSFHDLRRMLCLQNEGQISAKTP